MRQITVVAVLIGSLLLSGCVMKSDYLARVADIEGLQKDKAGLEAKNKATETALAEQQKKNEELAKQKEELEKQKAELEKQKADLEKQKANLMAENAMIKTTLETKKDQLSREVVDLKNKQAENSARIKTLEDELVAKNNQIAGLTAQVTQMSQEKEAVIAEKERAIAGVKTTYDSLLSELKQEIKQGEVQITQLKDKLTVNMVEKILFDSGSAVIKKNGTKVLDRVAEILKGLSGQQIKVEGHTDNVPIGPGLAERFPTNWELSTARATTVVRYLQGRGVSPTVLSAEGYADYRPVSPNTSDEGKAKNRRIEIVLIPLDVQK
jgi:chemotaxis protein MotB